jgi:hypothetical protein
MTRGTCIGCRNRPHPLLLTLPEVTARLRIDIDRATVYRLIHRRMPPIPVVRPEEQP